MDSAKNLGKDLVMMIKCQFIAWANKYRVEFHSKQSMQAAKARCPTTGSVGTNIFYRRNNPQQMEAHRQHRWIQDALDFWQIGGFMCIKFGIPWTVTIILVAGFAVSNVALIIGTSGTVTLLSSHKHYILHIMIQMTPSCRHWDDKGYNFFFVVSFATTVRLVFGCWYHIIFLAFMELERGEKCMWGSF